MKTRLLAAGLGAVAVAGSIALAVPAFAGTSTASTSSAATTTSAATNTGAANGCAAGHVPAVIEGEPASYHAGDPRGAWIWHDSNGYSIRVTHPRDGRTVLFTGEISSDRPIRVDRVQLEKSDRYWLSPDRLTLHFAFTNIGYVDGLDFTTACSPSVRFKIRADGALMSPSRVRLGEHAVAAPSNPFTVRRGA